MWPFNSDKKSQATADLEQWNRAYRRWEEVRCPKCEQITLMRTPNGEGYQLIHEFILLISSLHRGRRVPTMIGPPCVSSEKQADKEGEELVLAYFNKERNQARNPASYIELIWDLYEATLNQLQSILGFIEALNLPKPGILEHEKWEWATKVQRHAYAAQKVLGNWLNTMNGQVTEAAEVLLDEQPLAVIKEIVLVPATPPVVEQKQASDVDKEPSEEELCQEDPITTPKKKWRTLHDALTGGFTSQQLDWLVSKEALDLYDPVNKEASQNSSQWANLLSALTDNYYLPDITDRRAEQLCLMSFSAKVPKSTINRIAIKTKQEKMKDDFYGRCLHFIKLVTANSNL